MIIDLADFKLVIAVAGAGSMNRAAQELDMTQSNVSARIIALEERLGEALFHRTTKGVVPTPAGDRFFPHARRVLAVAEEAVRAVHDDGTPRGPLTIGSLETTTAMRLAPGIEQFVRCHGDIDLTLRTGTTRELVDMVLDRSIEGAFVCGPVDHPDLAEHAVIDEELVLVTAADVATIDAALAVPAPRIVVLRSGCSYRARLEGYLDRRGVVSRRIMEFGTLEAIVSCVAAGLGVSALPRDFVDTEHWRQRVAAHALPKGEGKVTTVFIHRHDSRPSSAMNALLDHVRGRMAGLRAAE